MRPTTKQVATIQGDKAPARAKAKAPRPKPAKWMNNGVKRTRIGKMQVDTYGE